GPVSVDFALADDLDTGMYRCVSSTGGPAGSPAARRANRGVCVPVSRANPIAGESPNSGARPAPARRSPEPARSSPPSRPTPAVRPAASSPPARQRTIEASVSIDGRTHTLRQGTNTFGRSSSSSDFVIDDPGVSRRHFEIIVEGDHAVANDLGSTNGTLLHGRKLTSANLADGDVLLAGEAEVRYSERDAQ